MQKVKQIINWLNYGGEAIKTISRAMDVIFREWPAWPTDSNVNEQKKE